MFITSYPRTVCHAVSNEKKPIPGLVNPLMRAVVLFDQIVERVAQPLVSALWPVEAQAGSRADPRGVYRLGERVSVERGKLAVVCIALVAACSTGD